MHHSIKIKDVSRIRASEYAMSYCEAREKLKTAARHYAEHILRVTKDAKGMDANLKLRDFSDDSPEGRELEHAARLFAVWHDVGIMMQKKAKAIKQPK